MNRVCGGDATRCRSALRSFSSGPLFEAPPRPMNIHHLELFYYVARHGGISAAVRHMPYGIQQPAVSSQILQLEETLGTKLFARTPFQLTPDGEQLYAFVLPFFQNLDQVAAKLR